MMIGPEPISMMRCRSARRGTDQIVDDGVEGQAGRPSGRASQLGGVTNEDWHLDGTHQRSVGVQYRIDAYQSKHALRERPDIDARPACDVVHLTRRPALEQVDVRTRDISDMEEVAHRGRISDRQPALSACTKRQGP